MKRPASPEVRESALAGSWYPRDAKRLSQTVRECLDSAPQFEEMENLLGIVSPHAGLVYSGNIAALAYKQAQDRAWDTVVLVAPPHRSPIQGPSIFTGRAVASPLGEMPVDGEVVKRLLESGAPLTDQGSLHVGENPIELQVPFIQTAIRFPFRYVEILVPETEAAVYRKLGDALASALRDRKTLLIGSSDLSHFPNRKDAEIIDPLTIRALSIPRMDEAILEMKKLEERFQNVLGLSTLACGKAAVMTLIAAMEKMEAKKGVVLGCSNSSAVSGDDYQVVGYGAAAYYR